ncbi:MAG: 3-phosphoshikimate 1-carboxyvinyltransferase [Flavobacteriaceae bacterium]|nr:3-phosphoshikimate 1-carboxyvinyltransferase [Flavobacteriaceae bacterium]
MNSLKISGFNINSNNKIIVSGSKSESNRVLILKYLFNPDIIIDNLSNSDDTKVLLKALENQTDIVYIHHAGTAMRFLTSLFAVSNRKNIILTGSDRMQQRPVGELVDSLRSLGADIIYEKEIGYPPLRFNGFNQTNKLIELRSDISSQFVSSLMLVAPYLNDGLQIKLVGNIFSKPYILLTCEIMKKFGFSCIFNKDEIKIKSNKKVSIKNYSVESDWSSASYLYSIVALSGIELNLSSFKSNSIQGDSKLSKLYENFGVKTFFKNDEIILKRSKSHRMKKFIELDLIENPDLAQTIIVTSLGLSIHTKLTGLNTLKIKETDRLVALKNEISKFNTDVIIDDQSIEINNFPKVLPENIEIDTYHDHRMALAFSPLSVLVKLVINDYGVISKSFPEYWTILQKLNFDLEFDN